MLEKKKFSPDENLIEQFLKYAKPFRGSANASAHDIINASSSEKDIEKFRAAEMVAILKRIRSNL
jgi:hypothetical protein